MHFLRKCIFIMLFYNSAGILTIQKRPFGVLIIVQSVSALTGGRERHAEFGHSRLLIPLNSFYTGVASGIVERLVARLSYVMFFHAGVVDYDVEAVVLRAGEAVVSGTELFVLTAHRKDGIA